MCPRPVLFECSRNQAVLGKTPQRQNSESGGESRHPGSICIRGLSENSRHSGRAKVQCHAGSEDGVGELTAGAVASDSPQGQVGTRELRIAGFLHECQCV